jgi:predicted PurR-regulated permease PerM
MPTHSAPTAPTAPRQRVPTRVIAVTIGMVLATAAILLLGWEVRRVLTWIVVAALLSVVLGPVVDLAEHRLRLRRALATLLVFLLFLIALAGIVTVFIRPLATEGPEFIDRLPAMSRTPAPGVARSAAWSSATTSISTWSATRAGYGRAPTGSPHLPWGSCGRSSARWWPWSPSSC